uniref:Uncharacterized protein n=1 Tax=Salix viminalis TaxID=40686 RepID=A0A6N2MBX4_SALVM
MDVLNLLHPHDHRHPFSGVYCLLNSQESFLHLLVLALWIFNFFLSGNSSNTYIQVEGDKTQEVPNQS